MSRLSRRFGSFPNLAKLSICSVILLWTPLASAQQKPGTGKNAPPTKQIPSQQFKGYGLPESVKKPPTDLPKVEPVDKAARDERIKVAKQIDQLITASLSKHSISPNPKADDYTFVRRAYLDITGTIPTLVQTTSYASEKSGQKAYDLVDSLLDTFDPKPGEKSQGETQPTATKLPGVVITDRMPKIAELIYPEDLNATIATTLGLPLDKEFVAPNGRPFKIADQGTPIKKILA